MNTSPASPWRQWPALMQVSLASLWRNKWASGTVAACVMLVVLVLLGFLAMADGYQRSQRNTGSPDVAVVLAEQATSEPTSRLSREQVSLLAAAPGIARQNGRPLASAEFGMTVAVTRGERGRQNITLRGMDAEGLALRPGLHLAAGRMFTPGRNEIVVGRRLAAEGRELALGATARLAGRDWQVVGIYALDATLFETEAWADIGAVQAAYGRQGQYQTLRARLDGPDPQAALERMRTHAAQDSRLAVSVQTERQFLEQQAAGTHNLLVYLGWPLAAVLAVGTVAGTFNTLSIAVHARQRSLRVLNLLGFSSRLVALCVLGEALLLSLLGGLVGAAAGWLVFNGIQGVTVGSGFTSVHFDWMLSPTSVFSALLLALAVGALGGLVPAWRVLRTRQGAAS
ncbi:ABC transporter permease [Pseudorhodoferax sp.]|uniref:ABC transporter permease n=1 Tax=Pseudorhodoferax sp. TaxID=1993553 RepID=UPI002DD68996|nr:ABC transporter permease [Pseudorhodoferax sp.]